jgi:hypothetical protein
VSDVAGSEARVCAIVKVRSIAETTKWYAAAGFKVLGVEDDSWAEVGRDGLVLQFVTGATPWSDEPGLTGSFYVHVPDVSTVHADIATRIDAPWGVESRPWGAVEMTLCDPNGYHITFTQPAV